jgi:hypothetical protein
MVISRKIQFSTFEPSQFTFEPAATYVNFFPVVMDRSDQSRFVPSDIEDGKLPNLIGMGKDRSHFLNI